VKPGWHPAWIGAALAAGALLGAASDGLTAGPYFNLLSPLLWGLIAWNVAVYAFGLWPGGGRRLAQALARCFATGSDPATAAARTAALLHAAAAGFALGLIAGLVLRGLVLDYRAGWASTLLSAEAVRAALYWGFEPARTLLSTAPPDAATVLALRVAPGQPANASAASWIGLMTLQLLLWVVLPRGLLTVLALRRATPPAAGLRFWVLPHGAAPTPAALAGLQALLALRHGPGVRLMVSAPLPWGDEDHPPPVPPGCRPLVLVDLAATPEDEVHGRLLRALAPARPLVVADESTFVQRFGRGERLLQRQAAWRALVAPGEVVCGAL
jgi:hypothetical protein